MEDFGSLLGLLKRQLPPVEDLGFHGRLPPLEDLGSGRGFLGCRPPPSEGFTDRGAAGRLAGSGEAVGKGVGQVLCFGVGVVEGLWRNIVGMGRGVVTGPLVVIYVGNRGVAEMAGDLEKVGNGSASTLGRLGEGVCVTSRGTRECAEFISVTLGLGGDHLELPPAQADGDVALSMGAV